MTEIRGIRSVGMLLKMQSASRACRVSQLYVYTCIYATHRSVLLFGLSARFALIMLDTNLNSFDH